MELVDISSDYGIASDLRKRLKSILQLKALLCGVTKKSKRNINRVKEHHRKKRAPGERHYAVIKRVFKAAHVMVTTVARVHVKMVFTAIAFNLFQLRTLKRQKVI